MHRIFNKILRGTVPLAGSPLFVGVVFITGASGIIAQVILLRELLVGFLGNELIIGIILANWVVAEALGAGGGGWLAEKLKNAVSVFVVFTLAFSAALPAAVYLSRIYKSLSGIPSGEGVGLSVAFLVSFIVLLPPAFCHGALFSLGAKIFSSLGKMYTWETLGTVGGGIIISYILLPRVNAPLSSFLTACVSLLSCFILWRFLGRTLKAGIFLLNVLMVILLFSGAPNILHRDSIARQWQDKKVLDYRNSLYGNIVVTSQPGQLTFFYNGQPIMVSPRPDTAFVEEFANLPLLFHPSPKDVLIVSSGAGGIINEILKYPGIKIDYTELDPEIIKVLRLYPDDLTTKELGSPRLTIIKADGRFFLQHTSRQYDLIFIGISRTADLTENRLFTEEFFLLTERHLKQEGILALWLPGSLAYLSRDLKDLNSAILNSLALAYAYVRVMPGDYNIFFASNSEAILRITPSIITNRITSRNINTHLLIPEYLEYRLDPSKAVWFNKILSFATQRHNQDLRPYAVFKTLMLWNKQFSPSLAVFFDSLEKIGFKQIIILILLLTGGLAFFLKRFKQPIKLALSWSIFTTGFFGMMVSLMLIFAFQVYTGYLYYKIGFLTSLFMVGGAVGSALITRLVNKAERDRLNFAWLELVILNFTLACSGIIYAMGQQVISGMAVFSLLFFLSGSLAGLQFPLAGKLYLGNKGRLGEACGILYGADLLGGWIAGIIGGVLLLPVLGVFNACLVIVLLKLSSLLLFCLAIKKG